MITDLTRRFSVDDVSLAWDRWDRPSASGTPFVLCHGFSGSSHDFALNIEDLAERRTVVTVDHRGHGRSQQLRRVDRYSLDRSAADLIALVDAEVGGPVDLLGHSMGGAIALRVTLARPDLIRSLILMDTSAWSFVPQDPQIAALIAGFIASFDPAEGLPAFTSPDNPETALIAAATPVAWQEMKATMDAAFDPYALRALGGELFDSTAASVRSRLGEIQCPVGIVVGEHDHPFVDQADELAAALADPTVSVVPGAYHSPQLTHAGEWTAAVEAHLGR